MHDEQRPSQTNAFPSHVSLPLARYTITATRSGMVWGFNKGNMTTEVTESKADKELVKKMVEMETNFRKVETFMLAARTFAAAYVDKFNGLGWRCWGWSEEIVFSLWGDVRDPKEIARRFGSDGWTREPDGVTCGQFHWVKTLDGVRLKIEGAEQLKPQVNPTVRL